jgi:hypothetical protein
MGGDRDALEDSAEEGIGRPNEPAGIVLKRFPVEVLPSGPRMLEETRFSSPTAANKVARRIPGVGTCAGRRTPRQS